AKIDTGAQTSAIHVEHLEVLDGSRVRFDVVVARATKKRPERTVSVETDLVRTARVRPSTGKLQRRPVVEALVQIGPVARRVELSLVSREHMLCRMLLGRTALAGSVLVDVSQTYLLTNAKGST
ncbi:MAG: ATP-dependent zinc protease, partial [Phycisphaerales bacterium]